MKDLKAYINTKEKRSDGGYDSYLTREVPIKHKPLDWQIQGLQYTASGYGARIPTEYMIKVDNRWRRVYAICYSNSATLYIGYKYNPCLTVTINKE